MFFKWLKVPESNATKEVKVAQLWEVRWHSRHGQYSSDTRPELETFLSEAEANDFATSLENAFRLIRHSSGTSIDVLKAK